MSGRAVRPRWRYIAFTVECRLQVRRNDFLSAFISSARGTGLEESFRITVFEPAVGILKVPHRDKDLAVGLLNSMKDIRGEPCTVTTLKTSGTIKTLKEKYLPEKEGGGRRRGRRAGTS
jgi:RNase P/RNase MRP subunit POP5